MSVDASVMEGYYQWLFNGMDGSSQHLSFIFFLFLFLNNLCFVPCSVLHKHMEGEMKHKIETELKASNPRARSKKTKKSL
jgi:hypothetical protein